jgi:Glycosyl transferase family 2
VHEGGGHYEEFAGDLEIQQPHGIDIGDELASEGRQIDFIDIDLFLFNKVEQQVEGTFEDFEFDFVICHWRANWGYCRDVESYERLTTLATLLAHWTCLPGAGLVYFEPMQANLTAVIPVYNGEPYIRETLESLARQSLQADRVIVLDNCSTDSTPQTVQSFKGVKIEYIRNPTNLGLFGNCNRALEFAAETKYLLLLCADDCIEPSFFEVLTKSLHDCDGYGLAYSLDKRIDEKGHQLSISGKASGRVQEIPRDVFLARKAEIANQAMSSSLMKTNYQKAPCQFRLDMSILADMAFWAGWGSYCKKIVQVNQPLCNYRWHGTNTTNVEMPGIQTLVLDEWKVIQMNEQLRNARSTFVRDFKLKGLFAVRTGIKAKRIRQQKNLKYSSEITAQGKKISGPLAWYMGQAVVEARDALVYGLLRRPRHPKNVFS